MPLMTHSKSSSHISNSNSVRFGPVNTVFKNKYFSMDFYQSLWISLALFYCIEINVDVYFPLIRNHENKLHFIDISVKTKYVLFWDTLRKQFLLKHPCGASWSGNIALEFTRRGTFQQPIKYPHSKPFCYSFSEGKSQTHLQ